MSNDQLKFVPRAAALAALVLEAFTARCGGSSTASQRDEVFYLHGGGATAESPGLVEVHVPRLDAPAEAGLPALVGVGLFAGNIALSRPVDWTVRAADVTPNRRFVTYQSPRQFVFSIFERPDPPEETWAEVLRRYEAQLGDQGAAIVFPAKATATANAQGRSYLVRTRSAGKAALHSRSHEVLLRAERRIVLVQMLQSDSAEAAPEEMLAALRSIRLD